jgi:hypothetical protein
VLSSSLARIASMVVVIAISATIAGAWPWKQKGQEARVRFLATSTLIRGTWGRNEATCLAELRVVGCDDLVLARLIDAYPNEVSHRSCEALESDSKTVLRVKRDPQFGCLHPHSRLKHSPIDRSPHVYKILEKPSRAALRWEDDGGNTA